MDEEGGTKHITPMEIKELGREGLIRRIWPEGGPDAPWRESVDVSGTGPVSTALLMEGPDFDLVYFPLRSLGLKAVTAAVAGIYASGGCLAGCRSLWPCPKGFRSRMSRCL